MPEWEEITLDPVVINPFNSRSSLGGILRYIDSSGPSSTAWPAANTALFIPFRVFSSFKVCQGLVGCGLTGGNNFDIGVYDRLGNRLVSSGSTARVASSEVVANLTDTMLYRGVYYMALASDSVGTFFASVNSGTAAIPITKLTGMKEMASAFPLPSTATFATLTSSFVPIMSLWRIPQ